MLKKNSCHEDVPSDLHDHMVQVECDNLEKSQSTNGNSNTEPF